MTTLSEVWLARFSLKFGCKSAAKSNLRITMKVCKFLQKLCLCWMQFQHVEPTSTWVKLVFSKNSGWAKLEKTERSLVGSAASSKPAILTGSNVLHNALQMCFKKTCLCSHSSSLRTMTIVLSITYTLTRCADVLAIGHLFCHLTFIKNVKSSALFVWSSSKTAMIILQKELLKQHPDTCGLAICWGFPSQSEFKSRLLQSLKLTACTCLHLKLDGWMVGRRSFPFGMASWQVRTLSFREGNLPVGCTSLRIRGSSTLQIFLVGRGRCYERCSLFGTNGVEATESSQANEVHPRKVGKNWYITCVCIYI